MTTRVVVADDQALVRAGFRALLDAEPDIAVVAEAADGAQAVELTRREHPDIVLMDVRMPHTDGLEATRCITSIPGLSRTRVIVLTTFELDEYVFGALRAGASGFLLKDIDPPDLLKAVRVVADGEALLAPRLTRRLIEAFVAQERAAQPPVTEGDQLDELTPREREVLGLMAEGHTNAAIAERLVVTGGAVEKHIGNVFMKLGLPQTDQHHRRVLAVLTYLGA